MGTYFKKNLNGGGTDLGWGGGGARAPVSPPTVTPLDGRDVPKRQSPIQNIGSDGIIALQNIHFVLCNDVNLFCTRCSEIINYIMEEALSSSMIIY